MIFKKGYCSYFYLMLTLSVVVKLNVVHSVPVKEQSDIAEEINELRDEVGNLQNRLNITEHELRELKERTELQADVPLQDVISSSPVSQLTTTTSAQTIDISVGSEVGFSAKVSQELRDLPTFSVIKYDYVINNAGNAYDPKTGIFTVPVEGMYMFAYFVEAIGTAAAEIQLVVDGMIRFPAISEPETSGNDDTGGNMVIEHLVKGQQVWIETYENENQNIYPGFTTFSGALIQ